MENLSSHILLAFGLLCFIAIGISFLIIVRKSEKIGKLQSSLEKLKKSFNSLDDQAKLIVKTDLQLNKTQEELDKRLGGLNALQKISKLISTTLDENEIFDLLHQALMTNLEFEKNLILIYNDQQVLCNRVTIGFPEKTISAILTEFQNNTGMINTLHEGRTISSINSTKENRESVMNTFNMSQFVFAPILPQQGIIGFVLVGNQSNAGSITRGDEEIISILASLIGQTLENARSFEKVFRSRQILETKIHERTKQLESALAEVQNISKTKSEFISAVSHELRTPLTSIKGYASILMTGKLGDIPDQVKERLGKINTHSDKLVNFINELLDISRIESGRVEMNFKDCEISDIVETVHDVLTPQLKEKKIKWSSKIDTNIPTLRLDDTQADRIFINLISNAIKFTPAGGTIEVAARLDNDTVKIEVSDTGIGISQQDIERLFDEFYRVDNQINQQVKGTGLGLPLAKKIVEAHGGRMWVTSQLNEGTTFHFTLPTKQASTKNPLETKEET
jgi:signal transduction histidine kinase